MRAATCLCAASLLVACAAPPPPPVPFRGPVPARIVVLPLHGDGLPDDWRRALDDSAHLAVAARGYAVIPAAVAARHPAWSPSPDETTFQSMLRHFSADAVLEREVAVVGAAVQSNVNRLEITWRIRGGSPLATLWEQRAELRPGAVVAEHLTGPLGLRSDDPLMSDEQLQGRGYGSNVTRVRATTPAQIAEDVQQRLAARLPMRTP
ncbi:MAG: hypothetical protein U1F36_22880 [Planctomycetota bacterium]